ncbi:MAG: HypC/HybG/HupF family hydrogenase formation chaperone [Cyclobacteriaceae bacterium]|nr:HypC/HybG/HupF family hydrogenase formation chaperone [Cyclobacteriaceae bacterium]
MCLAIPGKIVAIEYAEDPVFSKARVSFDGIMREISIAAVPSAQVGQYVLVHVGMAISIIDEEEALITLGYFKRLNK